MCVMVLWVERWVADPSFRTIKLNDEMTRSTFYRGNWDKAIQANKSIDNFAVSPY